MKLLLTFFALIGASLMVTSCAQLGFNEEQDSFYNLPYYEFSLQAKPLRFEKASFPISTQTEQKVAAWFKGKQGDIVTVNIQQSLYQNSNVVREWVDALMERYQLATNQLQFLPQEEKSSLILAQWNLALMGCDSNKHAFNYMQTHSSQFGCAYQKNQMDMAANKIDLAIGRKLELPSGVDVVSAVEALNSGKRMPLTEDFSSSVADE